MPPVLKVFKVKVTKEITPWITEVRWHPAQKLETLKNGGGASFSLRM